jgi:ABC-type transport system involved in multi-copper enzyme maturation permease subunit
MGSILKYILLTAFRDKLFIGLLVILIGAFGISSFLGNTALVEKAEMTIIYSSASMRIISGIGIILFVCFYIRRSFEHKEIQFILAKSISRDKFILSYWLGFSLVSLIITSFPIILMAFFTKSSFVDLSIWALSLVLEMSIIITFALASSLILGSAISAVLATFGFYFISRMMGLFVYTVHIPTSAKDLNTWKEIGNALLKFISVVFPRLDLFTKSEWLVYGIADKSDLRVILLQSLIYISFMLFISFFDFRRKQF